MNQLSWTNSSRDYPQNSLKAVSIKITPKHGKNGQTPPVNAKGSIYVGARSWGKLPSQGKGKIWGRNPKKGIIIIDGDRVSAVERPAIPTPWIQLPDEPEPGDY